MLLLKTRLVVYRKKVDFPTPLPPVVSPEINRVSVHSELENISEHVKRVRRRRKRNQEVTSQEQRDDQDGLGDELDTPLGDSGTSFAVDELVALPKQSQQQQQGSSPRRAEESTRLRKPAITTSDPTINRVKKMALLRIRTR